MWDKMAAIDRRWIYGLMVFVIALALIKPVGLAIIPSADSRKVYDTLAKLPQGSVVWLGMEFSAGGIPEIMPALQSVIRLGFSKGHDLKFVCAGMWNMAGDMADQAFSIVKTEFPDKQYGVDWVNIGYKPGNEVLLQQYLTSIKDTAQNKDFYQKSLDSLPLMSQVKTIKDCKAIMIFCTGTPGEREYIKHVTGPYNIPLLESCVAVSVPEIMPLLQSGQITGLLGGMKGAAEMEVLVNHPGSAMAGMDAQSFAHGLIIIFMILGNIGYFMTRNKKA